MSLKRTLTALPTLLRVGFSESLAYRAEMFIWVLSTTMPFVNMALWSAVAGGGEVGGYDRVKFVAYFLCTFIVRQLTGAWAAWQMNFEVRTGTMTMRLLRPLHPVVAYAMENLAATPLKVVVSLPVVAIVLLTVGREALAHDWLMWAVWPLAMIGSWLITFLANVCIGTLSLYMEQSLKLMDLWLAAFVVFSGYVVPVSLFPETLRAVVDWLPFRYQIGLPVELMTGVLGREAAVRLLVQQWLWVGVLMVLGHVLWQRGLKRFGAYGG
ncbi:MAG: ABC-2 family transporter protein [Myxococcaceae bacterium]|nr:ABC-2 family transporter protein [Myxococcaceae bacterium]MCI0670265.1 ABC-2 family transporter protein [Myxococcaceae bacterium]